MHARTSLLLLASLCLANPVAAQTDQDDAEPTTASTPAAESDALPDGVLAIVNGQPITQLAVDNVAAQVSSNGQSADPERILNELINLEVLTQEAEKLELDKEPEIATALHLQYTQTMGNAYLAEISETVDITDEALRAEYDLQTANVEESEFRASHVLLETEEDAKQVITDLADGADFAELAKERSTGPTGPEGGDLGWFQSGTMVAEFSDAVASMDIGATSEAPVKSEFGWHVIKLVDKREAALPDFDSVKPGLRNLVLRNELAKRVQEMARKADIKR